MPPSNLCPPFVSAEADHERCRGSVWIPPPGGRGRRYGRQSLLKLRLHEAESGLGCCLSLCCWEHVCAVPVAEAWHALILPQQVVVPGGKIGAPRGSGGRWERGDQEGAERGVWGRHPTRTPPTDTHWVLQDREGMCEWLWGRVYRPKGSLMCP